MAGFFFGGGCSRLLQIRGVAILTSCRDSSKPPPLLQQGGEEPPAGRPGLRPKRNASRPASSTHRPPAAKKLKPLTEKRLHELEVMEFQRQAQDLTDLQELLQELQQKGAAMSPVDKIVGLSL